MGLMRVYVNGHYSSDSLSNTKDKLCNGIDEMNQFISECETEFWTIDRVYSRIVVTCECGNTVECYFEEGTFCNCCGNLYNVDGEIVVQDYEEVVNN